MANGRAPKKRPLSKFEKRVKSDGAKNPHAVAAYIGAKKYGKKKFEAKAQGGRKKTGYRRRKNAK